MTRVVSEQRKPQQRCSSMSFLTLEFDFARVSLAISLNLFNYRFQSQ